MNYEMMQGQKKQLHGWLLELFGMMRSDPVLGVKGLHKRIDGILQYRRGSAQSALARAEIRRQRWNPRITADK